MIRHGALALVAALVLAGCGGDDEDETTRELGAPPEQFEPAAPDPELASTVAVVDVEGRPAAEPESLQIASDASLEELAWTNWGSDAASGEGELRLVVCEPNCAEGGTETLPASIELSEIVECEGQRYYSQGSVEGSRELREAPAVFVDPPC